MDKRIPICELWTDKKEIVEAKKILENGTLNDNDKIKELENLISEYLNVKNVLCVNSFMASMHLAMMSLGVFSNKGEDCEILISDFLKYPLGHVAEYCGFKPIFVDIDLKSYNMDYRDLKKKINKKRSKAIILSHSFGQSSDMNKIMKISEKRNIPIIEDVSCGIGPKFKGKFCGTFGSIGCFTINDLNGLGFLATNDDDIFKKANKLKSLGFNDKNKSYETIGYDYRPNNLLCSVAIPQFKKIEKNIKRRNSLARYWNKRLKEIDYINSPYIRKGKGNVHSYSSYNCLVTPVVDKHKLIKLLNEKGIECKIENIDSYNQECYYFDNLKDEEKCFNSTEAYIRSITFPLFYKLKKNDIDYIIDILKSIRSQIFF